jgi:hypothetical protein
MMLAIGTFAAFNDFIFLQNFFQGETRTYGGIQYNFASFGYSGNTTDLQAGNINASLVFSMNELVLNMATEAADNRWIVNVQTVWLDPETLLEQANYTTDVFMVTGFEHDHQRLNMTLSSPLDAISGDAPRRRLTESLVGALPSTGQVQLI